VPAQGLQEWQLALLGPVGHRLGETASRSATSGNERSARSRVTWRSAASRYSWRTTGRPAGPAWHPAIPCGEQAKQLLKQSLLLVTLRGWKVLSKGRRRPVRCMAGVPGTGRRSSSSSPSCIHRGCVRGWWPAPRWSNGC
jgi:hypothetical protein